MNKNLYKKLLEKLKNYINENPKSGCSYILLDGKFLNLKEKDHDFIDELFHAEEDYYDSFLDDIGCIHVGSGDTWDTNPYIFLNNVTPNLNQFKALLLWVDYLIYHNKTCVDVSGFSNSKLYKFSNYTADEIINRIKRYYASGNLYESRLN